MSLLKNISKSKMNIFCYELQEVGFNSEYFGSNEIPLPFNIGFQMEKIYEYLCGDNRKLMNAIRLFLSKGHIKKKELCSIFSRSTIDYLISNGILVRSAFGRFYSPLLLFPFKNKYIFTDSFGEIISNRHHNTVFQLGKEQEIFSKALSAKRRKRTLDLCTGSGMFAIFASDFSDTVKAVDINPRAVRFAKFNAALNNCDVEVYEGSLFEPFKDEKFDFITANPPYNPFFDKTKPKLNIHSGRTGEDVLNRILTLTESHLNMHGICQIISRFYHRLNKGIFDHLSGVLDVNKFNIDLLQTKPRHIFTLSNLKKTCWSVSNEKVADLLTQYKRCNIDRESYGILTLQKTDTGGNYNEKIIDFDMWD